MTKKTTVKGRGWRGHSAAHARAGSLGGQHTAQRHGQEFYQLIGKKGGQVSPGNFANNRERAQQAGRKGGKARAGSQNKRK